MFEEPVMFKPLSYSSEFVCIRQPLVLSTDNASFKAKTYRQSVQVYLCQWCMLIISKCQPIRNKVRNRESGNMIDAENKFALVQSLTHIHLYICWFIPGVVVCVVAAGLVTSEA